MRTMVDMSDVVLSPEFSQAITVIRSEGGEWIRGKFVSNEKILTMRAVVSASDAKEITMIPEGDRLSEIKVVHTVEKIYATRNENDVTGAGISDIIEWNGFKYKVAAVEDASDYGFYRTLMIRTDPSQ